MFKKGRKRKFFRVSLCEIFVQSYGFPTSNNRDSTVIQSSRFETENTMPESELSDPFYLGCFFYLLKNFREISLYNFTVHIAMEKERRKRKRVIES